MAAASTCSRPASFPPSPSPMPAITASSSPRSSGPQPSSCGRARKACAISAPACLPTNAFHLLQGVETLALRMQRHMENTAAVLDFSEQEQGGRVGAAPFAPTHPDFELAQTAAARRRRLHRQLRHQRRPRGRPQIHRGAAAGEPSRQCRRRQDAGDPSRQHHAPADGCRALKAAGLGEELVRLSIGIEAASDIIDDLAQALRASQKG